MGLSSSQLANWGRLTGAQPEVSGTATPRVPLGRAPGQRAELGRHVRPTVVLLGPTRGGK